MPNTEYLKNSYKWQLRAMAIVNVAAFWVFVFSRGGISEFQTLINSISIKDGIVALLSPVVTLTLDGLLSADAKARLVYWRYLNPLPGSRAFSQHLKQESRADPELLAELWGTFPTDPAQQNRLWYRMYKSVDGEIRIHEAHRAWLFSRDLTAYSALFLIIFGIITLITEAPWVSIRWYLVGLLVQYLVMMISARTYGVRFVRTVLTLASHAEVRSAAHQET